MRMQRKAAGLPTARQLAVADGPRSCAYCHVVMATVRVDGFDGDPRRMTRDHIVPRAWRLSLPHGVNNKRWACQSCNAGRATCGHCVGALACVRTVADETCVPLQEVLTEWDMPRIAQTVWRP